MGEEVARAAAIAAYSARIGFHQMRLAQIKGYAVVSDDQTWRREAFLCQQRIDWLLRALRAEEGDPPPWRR